jgi:hypothetical protein
MTRRWGRNATSIREVTKHAGTTTGLHLPLCAQGPITSLVELSLASEHRRGHGSLYDGLNHGQLNTGRLRTVLASQPIPRTQDGRIVLAIDVSHWLRPDANTSPERLFCHVHGRGTSQSQIIPGWPYSFVVALEPGRSSWTAVLDVVRQRPVDNPTDLAATQLRTVVDSLIAARQWHSGDPEIWIIGDSGYDGTRLAFLLADLPVRSWYGCARIGYCAFPHRPASRAHEAARSGTGLGSPSPTRKAGRPRHTRRPPTPLATASRMPSPGIGYTPS